MVRIRHRWIVVAIGLLVCALLVTPALARQKIAIAGPFGNWSDDLEEALSSFSKTHGADVEVVNAVNWNELWQKVAVMAAGGIGPDVLYGDNTTVMYFAREGLSQPIERFAKQDINLKIFPPSVLSALEIGGELYAIPTALSLHNLYYNVDLFAQAGLGKLPLSWESEQLQWDDYVSMVRKLTVDTDGDGQPNRFGTSSLGFGSIGFNMINMWGLHLFNLAGDEWYGDALEVVAALERIAQLRTEYNAVGGNFTAGTAAITPVQSYYLNTLAGVTSLQWSVGPMPKGTQRSSQAGFHGISIAKDTKQPAVAWQLIKYLTHDPKGVVLFTRAENRVPVHPQAGRDFVERWSKVLTPEEAWCIVGGVGYAYEDRRTRPVRQLEIRQLIEAGGARVYNRSASVQQIITEISPQIRALMK